MLASSTNHVLLAFLVNSTFLKLIIHEFSDVVKDFMPRVYEVQGRETIGWKNLNFLTRRRRYVAHRFFAHVFQRREQDTSKLHELLITEKQISQRPKTALHNVETTCCHLGQNWQVFSFGEIVGVRLVIQGPVLTLPVEKKPTKFILVISRNIRAGEFECKKGWIRSAPSMPTTFFSIKKLCKYFWEVRTGVKLSWIEDLFLMSYFRKR